MMPEPLMSSLPLIPLTDGCQVVMEARDPDTGAEVTGVDVTAVSIYGDDISESTGSSDAAVAALLLPGPESTG